MLNKKTKMFLLLTLIFFTAVGLSAVSATEIDADATDMPVATQEIAADSSDISVDTAQSDLSNKNTQLNKKTVENVKSEGEGTFADLATDIAGAEVTLDKSYIQGESEHNITITSDKVIDGNGNTITAHNGTFIINSGVTFTLKNTIIYSEYAPSMSYPLRQQYYYDIFDNGATVKLENVSFYYTGSGRQYGAPVNVEGSASLDVVDCHFDGYNTNMALIYAYGNGEKVTVDNSLFTNYLTANSAIYLRGRNSNLTVTKSNFTNAGVNSTSGGINYGAALYLNDYRQNVYVDNCIFDNLTSSYRGGAIYTSGNTTVKDSTFKNLNQAAATNNAGVIWSDNGNGVLCLENNIMENITANAADMYFNNGKINSTVNVIGEDVVADQEAPVEITLNVTDDNGNSIDFRTNPFTMKINDETITTTYGNGTIKASFDASYDPGVYPIKITYNDANILGDVEIPEISLTVNDIGLYKYGNVSKVLEDARPTSTVTIDSLVVRGSNENSIPIDKVITLDFNGNTINAKNGKVFDILPGAVVTIKNANIINVGNPSVSYYNSEGRVANISGGVLTFENVTFQNGNAPDYYSAASGSFILVLHNDSYLKLKDCYITNCTGTFINIVDGIVDIDNTVFENNSLSSVNAFIANGGSLEIFDSQFINNAVNLDVIRGQSNPLSSSAYGNTYTTRNKPLTVDNTTFINNTARNGRGAAINSYNDTTVTNSVFIKNYQSSSNPGGAILSEDGLMDIDSCVFINNTVRTSSYMPNNGTTIANLGGDMNIRNSIIVSNMTNLCDVYNTATGDVVANGNYWGQAEPTGRYGSSGTGSEITVENWAMLGISATPSEDIKYRDNVTITVGITKVTDGETESDATESFPDYGYIEFEAEGGDFEYAIVDVADGSASDKVTVNYNPVEVIATYMNDAVGITLDVTMPEPMDITLNDGNWTKYFDEETGTINQDLVVPDSTLRFDGVFTERDMVIDMPVTITTADNQAILNNCTIIVMSDNVIIKDIQMNNTDYSDVLIELFDASYVVIENNKLTITNNEIDQITRAIRVTDGEYNTIQGNTINTVGPENNYDYSADTVYTTSIEVLTSDDIIIKGNTISTEKNDVAATDIGTIYGIYVTGAGEDNYIYDVEISGNDIATAGEVYEYGLTINNAEDATIYNNTISTVSDVYADGIQGYGLLDSVIEENTIECASESVGYGIYLSGDMNEYIATAENRLINNTIIISSMNGWGIEFFYGEENIITLNNITIDCDYGVGIGISQASDDEITNNTINVITTMEGEPDTRDMISPIPAGVKIVNCDDPWSAWHSTNNNVIQYNNIVVDAPVATVPAVNVTARSSVTENYLISPKGVGNAAVLNNATGTTIRDNTPLVYILTNDTYYDFFGEDFVFMNDVVENGSYIEVRGPISEKNYFIFDNVELVIVNGEEGVLYNATIVTVNDAKVTFDGLVIDNVDQDAVYFYSEGNVLKNAEIKVNSSYPLYVVNVEADNNCISNVTIDATLPSNDVVYNYTYPYPVEVPASAALLIKSSNNLVDGVDINVDGSEAYEGSYSPTINGIYVLSLDPSEAIVNNTISNSNVQVVGCNCDGYNYAYGINVGVANDTTLDNVVVEVFGNYYANALQLWSAHIVSAGGVFSADANNYSYGVYATAMGGGFSDNIIIVGSEIDVEAVDATGIQFEGVKDSALIHSAIYVEGTNATAIVDKKDYVGNVASGLEVLGNEIYVTTDGDKNVMYFGAADDIRVTSNTIKAEGGSEIFFNSTTNGVVIENYIMINDVLIGNHAVMTTEDDTVIEDNTPVNEEYEAMIELLKMYQTSIITIDDIDNVAYRDEVTITGKLNDGMGNLIPDQTLTITVGDLVDEVITENGLFEYTFVAKQIGLNTIAITYEGTENHNEAEATAEFTVDKKESEVTINDIAAVTCNDDVKITGVIASVDGTGLRHVNVYVYLNGEEQHVTTDNSGVFRATFTTSTVGEQEVLVVYKGNANYLASNATATFTATGVKLVMFTVKPVTYRDTYTIQGKLTDAEGNVIADAEVQLTVNGETVTVVTDKNGKYTYKAQAKELGEFEVTASYVDEETGTELTATKTLEVTKRAVTLIVDEISDVAVGEEVTINGKLTDDIDTPYKNCNIYVKINGEEQHVTTDNKGVFTCNYTPTSAGTQNVVVTYKGNANYLGDKVTTSFEATA